MSGRWIKDPKQKARPGLGTPDLIHIISVEDAPLPFAPQQATTPGGFLSLFSFSYLKRWITGD
jgi:hypothetical protein